jgi:hypothetical protein
MRTTKIIIALLFLNGAATLLMASGIAADVGIAPNPGGDVSIVNSQVAAEGADGPQLSMGPQNASGGTLFGAFLWAFGILSSMVPFVFDGPAMLLALGVPPVLVNFVFIPVYATIGFDMVYLLTGRVEVAQ